MTTFGYHLYAQEVKQLLDSSFYIFFDGVGQWESNKIKLLPSASKRDFWYRIGLSVYGFNTGVDEVDQ